MKHIALWLIALYQKGISPFLPARCRYIPTCSEYAKQALFKYGFCKGGYLALCRILRCHPFSKHGPYDPVP